jgi:hypothetical protein
MFLVGRNILATVLKAVGDFQTTVLFLCFILTQSTVLLALRDVQYYTCFSVISSLLSALKQFLNTSKF